MPRRLSPILVLFIVTSVTSLLASTAARQHPDLSGTWVAVAEAPPDVPAAPSPAFGQRFALRLDGTSVTVTRPVRDASVVTTLPLDGTEVRSRIPGTVCAPDRGVVSSASWDAGRLVYRTVASVPPAGAAPIPLSGAHAFSLASPDRLVVETTMRVPNDPDPRAVATVYARSADALPPAAPEANVTVAPATIAAAAWLAGTWTGTVGGGAVEEHWTPGDGGSMFATSRTVRGPALAEFEFLCITERHGGLVYSAMPGARSPATDFLLTQVDEDSLTFENPAHDYPKKIRYAKRTDGTLEATISGDPSQRTLTFEYARSR